eukprot:TRINITY_DN593_c0_g1_i1.p1 TRINITY_DN593_c0_g1~~TRINITY_DN593_c0_g1_i1.p1  ORF type:complete len:685 (-),score=171.57 TRINITY_DN593_c0_g1_i1:12387-14441(-)
MSLHAFTPCMPLKPTNRSSVTLVTRYTPHMTNSRNPRRKRPNRRPQDLFRFLDEEESSTSRNRTNRTRRPRRKRNIDAEEDDSVSDVNDVVDDAVDDGFFSRYRKDAESGRIFDVSDLDADAKDDFISSKVDQQTAARAFDAVDKLFGNINAKKDQDALESSTSDERIDKNSWLNDIKARAATSGDNERSHAVDVQAVDESVLGRTADEDQFSEAQVTSDSGEDEPLSSSEQRDDSAATKRRGTSEKSGFDSSTNSSFQRFMTFARRGPASSQVTESRERDFRKEKSYREDDKRRSRALSLSSVLNTNRSFDRSFKDGPESDLDGMEDEVDGANGLSRRRNGRRQRFSAMRRVGGKTRQILSPPREWEAMDFEEVGRIQSDGRVFGDRVRPSHLRNAVADCLACRGSGTETCALCIGSGWVAPRREFASSDSEERRALFEEFWSTPDLVIDSQGNAQCIRCNGIGKQFCSTCMGSGSALEKGFNFNARYEVFDMFPKVSEDDVVEDDYNQDDFEDEDEEENDFESFQLYRGSVDSFDLSTGTKRKDDSDDKLEDDDVVLEVDDDEVADDLSVDEDEMNEVEDESEELLAALEAMDLRDAKRQDRISSVFSQLGKKSELLEEEEEEEDLDFEVEDEFEGGSEDTESLYELELDDDFSEGVEDVEDESAEGGVDEEYAFEEDEEEV